MHLDRRTALIAGVAAVLALVLGLVLGGALGGSDDTDPTQGTGTGAAATAPTSGAGTPDTGAGTSEDPTPAPSEPTPEASDPVPAESPSATATAGSIALDKLNGATVSPTVTVTAPAGSSEVRWLLDGTFLEKDDDKAGPFAVTLQTTPGTHKLEARIKSSSGRQDVDAEFTVAGGSAAATAAPGTSASGGAAKVPTTPTPLRDVRVSTVAELVAALSAARPGDRIVMADGTYQGDDQIEASAQGTAAHPIVLTGSRKAVLTTGETDGGGYGLHVTGSHWRLVGFSVTNAKKGIVMDGSLDTLLSRVAVGTIGQEAVHFRAGSANGAIVDSVVENTGLRSPQFGEGIYVGSANNNWPGGEPDRSDHVLIQGNTVRKTAAEGIDVKEGTTGGAIRGNTFTDAGTSNENSADSWVDVKGNDWLVEANSGSGTFADAFQTHQQLAGWGQNNVFTRNRVLGGVPGYAFLIAKGSRNTVRCDNVAGPAGKGLSNISCTK